MDPSNWAAWECACSPRQTATATMSIRQTRTVWKFKSVRDLWALLCFYCRCGGGGFNLWLSVENEAGLRARTGVSFNLDLLASAVAVLTSLALALIVYGQVLWCSYLLRTGRWQLLPGKCFKPSRLGGVSGFHWCTVWAGQVDFYSRSDTLPYIV